jgi:hypothetical protein
MTNNISGMIAELEAYKKSEDFKNYRPMLPKIKIPLESLNYHNYYHPLININILQGVNK